MRDVVHFTYVPSSFSVRSRLSARSASAHVMVASVTVRPTAPARRRRRVPPRPCCCQGSSRRPGSLSVRFRRSCCGSDRAAGQRGGRAGSASSTGCRTRVRPSCPTPRRAVFTRGSDAPPLLIDAARRLEAIDPALARQTYLEALGAAMFCARSGSTPIPVCCRRLRQPRRSCGAAAAAIDRPRARRTGTRRCTGQDLPRVCRCSDARPRRSGARLSRATKRSCAGSC